MMNWPITPTLLHTCAVKIVYKIWTRFNIYKNWNDENHWELLENSVIAYIHSLPLRNQIKTILLSVVKPVGRRYFDFLSAWVKLDTSEKWLTQDVLFDCLTVHSVGIVDQRETAKKVLGSKLLNNIVAFRLACVHYLEVEILRLWFHVSQYFLNKILFEYQQDIDCAVNRRYESSPYRERVQEPREVLYWILICSGIGTKSDTSVCEFIEDDYVLSWSDIFDGCWWSPSHISVLETMKIFPQSFKSFMLESPIFTPRGSLPCFYYYFCYLGHQHRQHIFEEHPLVTVSYFLQWPLSSLFLTHFDDFCDLLRNHNLVDGLIENILHILHGTIHLGTMPFDQIYVLKSSNYLSDVYCWDHLQLIWSGLWRYGSLAKKSSILNSFTLINDIQQYSLIRTRNDLSTLIIAVRELLLSNNKAFLYYLDSKKSSNLIDALNNVIFKYMPGNHIDIQLPYIHPASLGCSRPINRTWNYQLREELRPYINQPDEGIPISFYLNVCCEQKAMKKMKLQEFCKVESRVSKALLTAIQKALPPNKMNNSYFY